MKVYCITGLILLLIASVVVGFISGSNLGKSQAELAQAYTTPISTSPANQYNLLLIHAEPDGRGDAHLRSVWLMVYYADSPRVDLLPIYPPTHPRPGEEGRSLEGLFHLTPEGAPGKDFWVEMKALNTWWNAYILMDDFALIKIGEVLGETVLDPAALPPEQTSTQKEPLGAVETQAGYYQSICQHFSQNGDKTDFFGLMVALRTHTHTNLTPGQLYDVWGLLRSYALDLNCSFPSLPGIHSTQ